MDYIKRKTIALVLLAGLFITISTAVPITTYAANEATEAVDCSGSGNGNKDCTDSAVNANNCQKVDANCDLITDYINPFINFLSALVGLGALIAIITGGIMYSQSGGDSQKVAAAKKRVRNAIIALVAFAFLYGFINFLIPGGVI